MKAALGLAAAAAFAVAPAARGDLSGVTVEASLEAVSASWDRTSASVGPGVEFNGTLANGLVEASLDFSGSRMSFTVINHARGNELNPDGIVDLRLRELRLGNLVSPAGPVTNLTLIGSSFPAGSFDELRVTPGHVVWSAPQLIMPGRGTQWQATWQFATAAGRSMP